jgi:hypothetical protein
MPLTPVQGSNLKDDLFKVLDAHEPPLTTDERNGLNYHIGLQVDKYITGEGTPPPEQSTLKIVELGWPSATEYIRSGTQQHECQFKFTVDPNEVPRPGRLFFSPVGPAGTEMFSYRWSRSPFDALPEDMTPGSEARFTVSKHGVGQNVLPGETWYVAAKMKGGNTDEKFAADLQVNAA